MKKKVKTSLIILLVAIFLAIIFFFPGSYKKILLSPQYQDYDEEFFMGEFDNYDKAKDTCDNILEIGPMPYQADYYESFEICKEKAGEEIGKLITQCYGNCDTNYGVCEFEICKLEDKECIQKCQTEFEKCQEKCDKKINEKENELEERCNLVKKDCETELQLALTEYEKAEKEAGEKYSLSYFLYTGPEIKRNFYQTYFYESCGNSNTPPNPCYDQDGDKIGKYGRKTCEKYEEINLRDCNDTDPTIYPYAQEKCDNIDHDCDGSPDTYQGIAIGGIQERAIKKCEFGDLKNLETGDKGINEELYFSKDTDKKTIYESVFNSLNDIKTPALYESKYIDITAELGLIKGPEGIEPGARLILRINF